MSVDHHFHFHERPRRQAKLPAPRRLLRRLLFWFVLLQASVVAVIVLADRLRKRRVPSRTSYPWEVYPEVAVDRGEDRVTLYTHGSALYEAMLEAIESAEDSILIETFIWKGDSAGVRLLDALARKAREGVRVHAIFDGFANIVVDDQFQVFPPEVELLVFRPVKNPLGAGKLTNWLRDHRKILIIDYDIAFTGGFNIGSAYCDGSWRDTHVRLRGPGALELRNAFVDFWNIHRDEAVHSRLPDVEHRPWQSGTVVHRNDPFMRIFPIRACYLEAIDRAEQNIYLTHAYFIPDRAFRRGLVSAAKRGVDVRIMLPWHSNHVVADWLARHYFGELLRAGVRLFGYRDIMIHSKTATIDGVWSTVGTANIDRWSMLGNYEVNIEVYSEAMARQMEAMFQLDCTNCLEIDLERWEQRPTQAKFAERVLGSLRPLA